MKNNIPMNEQKDFFPETQRTLKHRRRLVISVYSIYVLDMFSWWLLVGLKSTLGYTLRTVLVNIPVLLSLICVICYAMLFSSIRDIARAKDKDLDERQRMVRDRAYRYAYRVIGALFLLFVWYFSIYPSLLDITGVNLPLPNGMEQGLAVFFGIGLIVWTLPTSIASLGPR